MSDTLQLLQSIWTGVLTHLWQSTLVLLPLFLLGRGLRRAPAWVTETLWSLALLKLLLPLALFGPLVWELVDFVSSRISFSGVPTTLPVVTAVTALLESPPGLDLGNSLARPWPPVVVIVSSAVWLGGFLGLMLLTGRDLRRVDRLASQPLQQLPVDVLRRARRILGQADIPLSRVSFIDDGGMPAVTGLLCPRLLVPRRLFTSLSDAELIAVLRHEDAHRRRRDPLRALLQRLCLSLFFFYPLMIPIVRRLRESAEYACDENALAGDIDASRYARALARSVQCALAPSSLTAAAGSGGFSLLQKRLQRLHNPERRIMSRYRLILAAAVLLVCAGTFLPLSLVAEAPPPPPPPAPSAEIGPGDDPPPPPKKGEDPPPPPKKIKDAPPPPPPPADKKGEKHLVTRPELIHFEPPEYPESARKARASGTVHVMILVGEEGEVAKAKIKQGVEGHPELDEAALKAAYQCRFEPGTRDGEPVEAWVKMPIEFKLE